MKKLFLSILIVVSVLKTYGQNTFHSDILEKWKGMKSYTLEVANLMPEDQYSFKPVADENSFAFQLIHMANNMNNLSSKFLLGKEPSFDLKLAENKVKENKMSKTEVIAYLSEAFDFTANSIQTLSSENLEDTITFWGGTATKRKIILLLNDHQTHHRGQLIVYLRLKGIKPPKYIGW